MDLSDIDTRRPKAIASQSKLGLLPRGLRVTKALIIPLVEFSNTDYNIISMDTLLSTPIYPIVQDTRHSGRLELHRS